MTTLNAAVSVENSVNEIAERIVKQHVICCVSVMVSEVFKLTSMQIGASYDGGFKSDEGADDLHNQCVDLMGSEPDYEEAARCADWLPLSECSQDILANPGNAEYLQENTGDTVEELKEAAEGFYVQVLNGIFVDYDWSIDSWEELCGCQNIDTDDYRSEVFEHWVVSDWFADKLLERGGVVDMDFMGLAVWGRCTSGQRISMDGVVQDIAKSLL